MACKTNKIHELYHGTVRPSTAVACHSKALYLTVPMAAAPCGGCRL